MKHKKRRPLEIVKKISEDNPRKSMRDCEFVNIGQFGIFISPDQFKNRKPIKNH